MGCANCVLAALAGEAAPPLPGDTSAEGGGAAARVLYLKGWYHNFFYRSSLIFWIDMGCGTVGFVQRGLKLT